MTNSEGKSLPKKIAEDIIAFILEENLQPGDKLPNETVLCERLNVGRSSLREAMRALASRNIVTIRQGSGTYVASSTGVINDPLGLNFIKNKQKLIHDLMEIRFLLEPSIAALAAMHAEDKEIQKIYTLCDEAEELLNAHKDHSAKDIELHTAIALSSKNIVVPRLVPVIFRSIPLLIESTGNHCVMKRLSHTGRLQTQLQPTMRSAPMMRCTCIWPITESGFSPTVKV